MKYTHCEYSVMPKKVGRLNIRIDEKLKKRLERQAEKEDRSVSNMILKVMRDYLDARENK
jgi:predicted transcriptional regulator